MSAYLLITAFVVFVIYYVYANIKAMIYASKCFTEETKQEHNFPARLKALLLPKSMWLDKTEGKYVSNLLKANKYWQHHIKMMFASIGMLFTAIFIIMLPDIYYLLTH